MVDDAVKIVTDPIDDAIRSLKEELEIILIVIGALIASILAVYIIVNW